MAALLAVGLVALGSLAVAPAALGAPAPAAGPTSGGTQVTNGVAPLKAASVGAANNTGFAIDEVGNIWSWGSNGGAGLLGVGPAAPATTTDRMLVSTPPGVAFTQVIGAFGTAFALDADGRVWSWGAATNGLLGDGSTAARSIPALVTFPDGTLITQIAAGNANAYALDDQGHAWAWGAGGANGLNGDGMTTPRSEPVRVDIPDDVQITQIVGGTTMAYALDADGAIWAWGANTSRQLGVATPTTPRLTPAMITTTAVTFTQVAAGAQTGFALSVDGQVYVWGANNSAGLLGTGTDLGTLVSTPQLVTIPGVDSTNPITRVVSSGLANSVASAIDSQGNLFVWGLNSFGESGVPPVRPTFNGITEPVTVAPPTGSTIAGVAEGNSFMLAIDEDGQVWSWGRNNNGQLGNPDVSELYAYPGSAANPVDKISSEPVPVNIARTVTEVSFGGVPGANLQQENGAWTVDTPAQCGVQDVVVSYLGNSPDEVFPGGFTFGAPASFTTPPNSGTTGPGGTFTASVAVAGDDAPTVQWQQEGPIGTWTDVPGATGAALSVTGLTATTSFRAVAANCWGPVSAVVTATVPPAHSVTYDANGGTGTTGSQTDSYPADLAPNGFTREGYTFAGWNTAPDGSGTAYADGQRYGFAADLTLYAQWEAVSDGGNGGNSGDSGSGGGGSNNAGGGNNNAGGGNNSGSNNAGGGNNDLPDTGAHRLAPTLAVAVLALLAGTGLLTVSARRRRA